MIARLASALAVLLILAGAAVAAALPAMLALALLAATLVAYGWVR